MRDGLLFETWDGAETTLDEDLLTVLEKHRVGTDHGRSELPLVSFMVGILDAVNEADGNTSQFTTSAFILYKELTQDDRTYKSRRITR